VRQKQLVIFLDSGDTIVDTETIVKDEDGYAIKAEVIPGADVMVKTLFERGYTLALVADGKTRSIDNIHYYTGLRKYFSAHIYSEDVKERKPGSKMFIAAMQALGLNENDKSRIIMVGNHLGRDIKGANQFGITSVFLKWTPKFPMEPSSEIEIPDYTIHRPIDLLDLVEKLNNKLTLTI